LELPTYDRHSGDGERPITGYIPLGAPVKTNRRILIIALVLVWVAGLGVWGWAALGPDSTPEVEASAGDPSPTPTRGDVDDGFQNAEEICSKIDLTSLSTTTGLVWTEATETETSWDVDPIHSYGCHSFAPDQDTSITLSVGIYDAAHRAIREYDASLATLHESLYEPEENIDPSWSRSLIYSGSRDTSANDASYFVTAQADNLVLHARIVFGAPNGLVDEASTVAAIEVLRIGEQIQSLLKVVS